MFPSLCCVHCVQLYAPFALNECDTRVHSMKWAKTRSYHIDVPTHTYKHCCIRISITRSKNIQFWTWLEIHTSCNTSHTKCMRHIEELRSILLFLQIFRNVDWFSLLFKVHCIHSVCIPFRANTDEGFECDVLPCGEARSALHKFCCIASHHDSDIIYEIFWCFNYHFIGRFFPFLRIFYPLIFLIYYELLKLLNKHINVQISLERLRAPTWSSLQWELLETNCVLVHYWIYVDHSSVNTFKH